MEGVQSMIKKTKPSIEIIEYLKKDHITNLNILGIMENEPSCEIFVDSLEESNGVHVRLGYFNYLYTESDEFLEKILVENFKEGNFGFSGVREDISQKIKERSKLQWENKCGLYYLKKENLNTSLIKNQVQSIDLKDSDTINNFYEFKGEKSLERIRDDIIKRPSSGIYINGELVSWVLVHNDNSMGIMYTKKEYRKNGYALDLTVDLSKKIIELDKIPFLHIISSNKKSPGLAIKAGFTKYSNINWFGISIS